MIVDRDLSEQGALEFSPPFGVPISEHSYGIDIHGTLYFQSPAFADLCDRAKALPGLQSGLRLGVGPTSQYCRRKLRVHERRELNAKSALVPRSTMQCRPSYRRAKREVGGFVAGEELTPHSPAGECAWGYPAVRSAVLEKPSGSFLE